MRLYKTTITPLSNFGTTLRGDTLFGQMCWVIRYSFGEERLKKLLSCYDTKPFLIVSDAFASGYLPKPTAPMDFLGEDASKKKENRKKIWLTLHELQGGRFTQAKTNEEAKNISKSVVTIKNSLNYKTFTTDDTGSFAPYGESELFLSPKDIYLLIDEDDEERLTAEELKKVLALVGKMGYGKNASIGKGVFEVGVFKPIDTMFPSHTFMTLSPFVFDNNGKLKECYYEPFTRFGKHGAEHISKNPFKAPLLMGDCGAILIYEEEQSIEYVGKAITGHSTDPDTVHQGYAIVIPIKGEKQ